MRPRLIIIGAIFVLFAIPSYIAVPHLITLEMSKLPWINSQSDLNNQIFAQLGFPPMPPINSIIIFIQYSIIGIIVAGLGIIAFGVISKKAVKQSALNLPIESTQRLQDEEVNPKALHLLQERLAKGEITSSQFQNLKKMIEDKI